MKGFKLLLVAAVTIASANLFAGDYKKIFVDTFESCISAGWIECDKRFYGPNRGEFGLIIELAKSKEIKEKYLHFINNNYGEDCDKSKLIYLFTTINKMEVDFRAKDFINDNVNIKEKDGVIFYKLDDHNQVALVPGKSGYKISISNKMEKKFRSSKRFEFYVYQRVLNNIHLYHMAEARRKKLSCERFIAGMNEALSPITYEVDKNKKNREFYKSQIVRSSNDIIKFYYTLN